MSEKMVKRWNRQPTPPPQTADAVTRTGVRQVPPDEFLHNLGDGFQDMRTVKHGD